MTPSGNEPVNVQFLAQCLYQLSHRVAPDGFVHSGFRTKTISFLFQMFRENVVLNLVQICSPKSVDSLHACLTCDKLWNFETQAVERFQSLLHVFS